MNQWKKVIIPIVILYVSLLVDGTITSFMMNQLQTSFGLMIPRLFILSSIILAFHLEPRHMYSLSLLFGFIYDSYYSGVLGIYMAVLMILTYVILHIRRVIEPHLLILVLLSIILLTINEFFVFAIYRVIDLTAISAQTFMAERLGATLTFNAILMLVLGYPLIKAVQFIDKDEKENSKKTQRMLNIRK